MWLTIIIALALIAIILYRSFKRPPNYPPGPTRYPLVGSYFSLDLSKSSKTFYDLYKKYGKIVSIKMGSSEWVILNDPVIIKKYMNGSDLLDRPQTFAMKGFMMDENAGISTSSGDVWVEQRRFAVRHLRDFGFGKSKSEEYIKTEIEAQIDKLKKKDGQAVELAWDLNIATTNIIWRLVSSIRMDLESKSLQKFTSMIQDFFISFGELFFMDAFPWITKVLPKSQLKTLTTFEKYRDKFYNFFKEEIDQHKKDFRDEDEDRDLIDSYIRKMKKDSSKPGFSQKFEDINLQVVIGDLFSAGGETTATSLRWAFIALTKYPEIQKKIQDELRSVIGHRLPDLADRENLVYLEAFIMELHRYFSLLVIGFPHSNNSRDIELMGYTISKETQVFPCVYVCHHSPEYWDHPEKFMPNRFINEKGKIQKSDALMPFGLGRRSCPGEILANAQLFLTIGSLLQKFNFEAVGEVSLETESEVLVRYPKSYKMIVRARE